MTLSQDYRGEGVFLGETPSIQTIKKCCLFWNNIIVYESYLSDIIDNPELVDVSKLLFKNNILKIINKPDELRRALHDKIYYGLDEEIREYLLKYPEKVAVDPKLPKDHESIINESSKIDDKDSKLKKLIDEIIKTNTYKQWMEPAIKESMLYRLPKEANDILFKQVQKIADMQYNAFHAKLPEDRRYGFKDRNERLLEQINVSSALYVEYSWIPYYQYKLGDYSIKNARRYLESLKTIQPFIENKNIEDFTIEDIIKIRKNRRWNNAMQKIAQLCNNIKYDYDSDLFLKEMQSSLVRELQNALDQEETTQIDLGKSLGKNSVYTAIGVLPIIGPVVSTVTSLADPLLDYFIKTKRQKSLPFFLNDLRKLK